MIITDLRYQVRQPLGVQPAWQPLAHDPSFRTVIINGREERAKNNLKNHTRWTEQMTSTELSLIHFARSLIVNTELILMQKPLRNYNASLCNVVMKTMRSHVDNRGLGLLESERRYRRPRTIIYSSEGDGLEMARGVVDAAWQIVNQATHVGTERNLVKLW